jgi:hypothetical protein
LEAIKPSPRAQRENPILPRASLRAQDRSRGAPTHDSPQAPAQRPNHPTTSKRQRDRAGASIGSDQTSPSRTARKPYPPPSFPARAGPIPRSPHPRLTPSASPTTEPPGGSGIGPEQALERRHPDPHRATARKLSRPQRSLRAQDRSRGAPTHDSPQAPAQRPNHPAAAGPGRSKHWNVDTLIPIARQRESRACPQRSLRAQDRSRGAPTHDSPQAPAQRPNHPAAAGSGRSEHRKRSNLSLAHSAKAPSYPELPCERRHDPAEPPPTTPTHAHPIR